MDFRSLYILYERQRDTRKKFVENPVHGNRRVGGRTSILFSVLF